MKTTTLIRLVRSIVLLTFAVGISAGGSGCILAAVGAGAGAVAYVRGELTVTLNEKVADVGSAADKALKKLQFSRVSEAKDALYQEYVARTADDKKVIVSAKSKGERLTELKIRVGTFGDENRSQTILEAIKAGL